MPQVSPYLKPESTPRRGGPPGAPERDALNMTKLPVAGFWRRFGALLFDLLAIYLVLRVLTSLVPEPFFALGSWGPKVGSLLLIAYFTLGNGPVGKGRTLGKFLTGIRTTDYAGNVPSLPQALLRTLLLFPILVLDYWITPLVLEEGNFIHIKIDEMLSGFLMIALFFGMVLTIVFNPFKQGLHDYLVRTLVRPVAAPQPPFADLCALVGERWRRFQIQPIISGTVTFGLIWGAFLVLTWPGRVPPERIERIHREYQLMEQAGLPGMRFGGVMLQPPEGDIHDFHVQTAFLTEVEDEASTSPLGIGLYLHRQGQGPLSDPDREKAEVFARRYYAEILRSRSLEEIFPSMLGSDTPNKPPRFQLTNPRSRPIRIRLHVFQGINIVFFYEQKEVDEIVVDFPPLGEAAWGRE